MGKILSYIAATVLAAACWGCNTTGCLQNQSSVPLAGFFASGSDEAILIDSLYVYGIGAPSDSSLISGSSASMVYLPFRSTTPSTAFCFRYLQRALDYPQLNDTISFAYTAEPKFVSEECGAMYCYTIQSVATTTHLIDSVSVIDPYIDNFDTMRIKIYFKVQSDDDGGGSGDEDDDPGLGDNDNTTSTTPSQQ